jgi:zinc transport system ATP-binding protein
VPSEPILVTRGIRLAIRGRSILDNVGFSLRKGEIVTLIGPNGAGKTTLVRVVLGLAMADAGSVVLRPGTRIGYMPQTLVVDQTLPLTVQRFVTLGTPASRRQTLAALAETGAEKLIKAPVQTISGGELRRVLLARALLRDPDLLVLDEPVQGVDVNGQIELYQLIQSIRQRRGCGVLMVSHDLHLVMASSDHVLCLNHHVCCAGRPESVSRHPAYLELFGSAAAEHLAVYHHHHNHQHDLHGNVVETNRGGDPGG